MGGRAEEAAEREAAGGEALAAVLPLLDVLLLRLCLLLGVLERDVLPVVRL